MTMMAESDNNLNELDPGFFPDDTESALELTHHVLGILGLEFDSTHNDTLRIVIKKYLEATKIRVATYEQLKREHDYNVWWDNAENKAIVQKITELAAAVRRMEKDDFDDLPW